MKLFVLVDRGCSSKKQAICWKSCWCDWVAKDAKDCWWMCGKNPVDTLSSHRHGIISANSSTEWRQTLKRHRCGLCWLNHQQNIGIQALHLLRGSLSLGGARNKLPLQEAVPWLNSDPRVMEFVKLHVLPKNSKGDPPQILFPSTTAPPAAIRNSLALDFETVSDKEVKKSE